MSDEQIPKIIIEGDATFDWGDIESVGLLDIADLSRFSIQVSGSESTYDLVFGIGNSRASYTIDENNKPVSLHGHAIIAEKRG